LFPLLGLPLGLPFGLPLSGLPFGLPLSGLPFGLPLSGLPFGLPLSGLPFGLPLSGLGVAVDRVAGLGIEAGLAHLRRDELVDDRLGLADLLAGGAVVLDRAARGVGLADLARLVQRHAQVQVEAALGRQHDRLAELVRGLVVLLGARQRLALLVERVGLLGGRLGQGGRGQERERGAQAEDESSRSHGSSRQARTCSDRATNL